MTRASHAFVPGGPTHRRNCRVGHAEHKIDESPAISADLAEQSEAESGTAGPPTTPGWVQWAEWRSREATPILQAQGSWEVPPEPANDIGQVIFLNLATQTVDDPIVNMTVTLQWGKNPLFPRNKGWGAACFVQSGRTVTVSRIVPLEPGDSVDASIERKEVEGGGVYLIRASVSSGKTARLRVADPGNSIGLRQVFGAALEAYCREPMDASHYPAADRTVFRKLRLGGAQGPLQPSWKPHVEGKARGRKVTIVDRDTIELRFR